MTYSKLNNRVMSSLIVLFTLGGCGGSDDPKPENFPANEIKFTSADISGTAVKGILANAEVSVEQLNGSNLTIPSRAVTDESGRFSVRVQGDQGYAINGAAMVYVAANENSSMHCDAQGCGIGELLAADELSGLRLSSIAMLSVEYGNNADDTDLELQVNGLSTLASRLIRQQAEADALNISTAELLEAAMQSYSSHILKALGVDIPGRNIFNSTLVDAASLDALQSVYTSNNCSDDSEPSDCSETVDIQGVKLSLINGALAGLINTSLVTGERCEDVEVSDDGGNITTEEQCSPVLTDLANLAEVFEFATSSIGNAMAAVDNATAVAALKPLRQALLANFSNHPFIADLGLIGEDIVDVELGFKQTEQLSGPRHEISTSTATVTARASISEAEAAAKAFDDDVNTKWLDNQAIPTEQDPSWIQVEFEEAQAISSLFITSGNDAEERDPENFHLAGSNDGATWVRLAEVVGARFDERLQRQEFRFSNGLEYRYYRLNITKNAGDTSLMQIGDIDLLGPRYTSQDHSDPVETLSINARGRIGEAESEGKAFDNSIETKWLDNSGVPGQDDPSWIEVTFEQGVAVNTLALTSGNDAPERDPENFTLLASNDEGITWIKLAEWAGVGFDARLQRQFFTLNNALPYSVYRLNITKNRADIDLMQLTEIELIGPKVADVKVSHEAGVVYEGRASISEGEATLMAFDGDTTTKWLDNAGVPSADDPSWVTITLPEARAVNRLSLTSANDALERDPENFNLQGSTDGVSWITLAEWIGEGFDQRFERRELTFTNSLAFPIYRFNITKNAGDNSLTQIGEIELIAPTYSGIDYSSVAGVLISARASISESEPADKAFDDDIESKWLDNGGLPSESEPSWIQIDLPEAQIIDTLGITSANDAIERDPADFELLGSNDLGETWVSIGSWSGESFDQRFQRKIFATGNGFAYATYRLSITKNQGENAMTQIAEIELIGQQ